MKKEIDLTEYGREIIRYKNIPEQLDRIQLELAGFYAYYSEQMIDLELAQATFGNKTKTSIQKSQKATHLYVLYGKFPKMDTE